MNVYIEVLKLCGEIFEHISVTQTLSDDEYNEMKNLFESMADADQADKIKTNIGIMYLLHGKNGTTLYLFYNSNEKEQK